MKRLLGSVCGLTALLLLAGCGIKSGLERPDPMWNAESARAADEERRDQARAARAERDARRGVTPETATGAPPLTSPDPIVPSQTPTPPPTTP